MHIKYIPACVYIIPSIFLKSIMLTAYIYHLPLWKILPEYGGFGYLEINIFYCSYIYESCPIIVC